MKMKMKILCFVLTVVFIAACFSGCGGAGSTDLLVKTIDGDALAFDDSNGVSVHDPSLFKANNGKYYVTGSHIAMAESDNLIDWNTVSAGVYDSNKILVKDSATLRESYEKAFKWCDGAQRLWEKSEEEWETNVWASDIIYNKAMKKYCYYACSSVWGTTASVIWLAVSDSPDGTYEFVDTMIYSGFNRRTTKLGRPKNQLHYSFTNIKDLIKSEVFTKDEIENMPWFDSEGNYDCSYGKYPNAIDPTAFYDKDGMLWLVYGSYSGGIYVMPLIEETGLPDYSAMRNSDGYDLYFGKQITQTNETHNGTGEGPYIIYDDVSGYYYLFLTYGGLDALGGYCIAELRSDSPDGEYTGERYINGNYQFSFDDSAFLSAGHSSCMIDDDGGIYQAYHQRYNDGFGGFHNVQIHQMLRTNNGYLTMLPLAYNGEKAVPVTINDVIGEYELIKDFKGETQKTDNWENVDEIINTPVNAEITSDGKLIINGNEYAITLDSGKYTFCFNFNGEEYNGAFCKGTDTNGKEKMTFSALSDKTSIWAVSK